MAWDAPPSAGAVAAVGAEVLAGRWDGSHISTLPIGATSGTAEMESAAAAEDGTVGGDLCEAMDGFKPSSVAVPSLTVRCTPASATAPSATNPSHMSAVAGLCSAIDKAGRMALGTSRTRGDAPTGGGSFGAPPVAASHDAGWSAGCGVAHGVAAGVGCTPAVPELGRLNPADWRTLSTGSKATTSDSGDCGRGDSSWAPCSFRCRLR